MARKGNPILVGRMFQGSLSLSAILLGNFFLGSGMVTGITLVLEALVLLGLVFIFHSYRHKFNKKGQLFIYSTLYFLSLVYFSQFRVYLGDLFSAYFLTFFIGTCTFSGSSGSSGGVVLHGYQGDASSSSEWFTYTSDLEDSVSSGRSRSTSSVNQPIQREQAGPSNALPAPQPAHVQPQPAAAPAAQQQNHLDQPFGEGGEREARAQEHARISAEVETITNACENLEAAMVRKAHILLHQRGVTLEDPEDVKRALQLALHDDWEHDIDDRRKHFTVLRRDFGTARCERWNPFIDELKGLGNHQVNARYYVD